ncbi:MAG: S9 family peptidase, partial [Bacteroidetes bacterium]|nr:S9 family peptidase [Bacteroidota bacterium]
MYDAWQSIGEEMVSNNGKYVVYTINPQEGDGALVIQTSDGKYKKEIARGYDATITEDNLFVVFKIKPLFKETREAKIKKRKPDEMPKDSLGIVGLGKDSVIKVAGVKNYKTPGKSGGWLAYIFEKGFPLPLKSQPDSLTRLYNMARMADSLDHVADSLRNKAAEAKTKGMSILLPNKKTEKAPVEEGSGLILKNTLTGEDKKFALVKDYLFSKNGKKLLIETTDSEKDPLSRACILLVSLPEIKIDTVMKNFNEAANFAFDENGSQLAFVAERDSSKTSLHKFYKLWYYKDGFDSAVSKADKNSPGIAHGMAISENYKPHFSQSGSRLFFGLATIKPLKDTTVPDFEKAGLDIWNYKDDELQPEQLVNLEKDLKRSYLTVWDADKNLILQLGDEKIPEVESTKEGDGSTFYASSDFGKRAPKQWQGFAFKDVYAINTNTGERKLIIKNFKGNIYPSYTGKYLLLYDDKQKNYSCYNSKTGQLYKVAADIKAPLYDEENDVPDDPPPYGIAKWMEADQYVLIYDRYDIWKVDPNGKEKSMVITLGRKAKFQYRKLNFDPDEKFITMGQQLILQAYDEAKKNYGLSVISLNEAKLNGAFEYTLAGYNILSTAKSKNANTIIYLKENFESPPNVF